MKAARIFGPRDLRVVDVPIRALDAAEVLCQVVRCGVCGTDASIFTGEASFVKQGLVPFPMTPGHEWSGVVTAVGAEVDRFQVGDRVVGDDEVSCGSCPECRQGNHYECRRLRAVGTIQAWDGAYAEYIVMPQRHLFAVPQGVDFDNAALAEPAANAFNCVRQAGVTTGSTVLVHGTGPVGLMAVRLAKVAGAARVLVSGRRQWKLEVARRLGADVTVDTNT